MEKKRDSFKSDDELVEEEEHRRQTRRRLLIVAVSSIVLVAATVGILVPLRAKNNTSSLSTKEKQSIKSICSATLYQESCYSSIYSLKQSSTNTSQSDLDSPKQIFMLSLQVSFNELATLHSSISSRRSQHSITQNALNACSRLIQDAMDHVNMSIASTSLQTTLDSVGDVRTWLSTAITDQQTCLDGLKEFENIPPSLRGEINASMVNATIFTSNSLAIISKIPAIVQGGEVSVHRKVLQKSVKDLHRHRRRLVEADLRPNLKVAKDGSGDYETITEAVNAMPKRSKHRFFIYVKEGEYKENVVVDTNSWNLMIYGDGMGKTVVSSNLNHVDGVGTYDSATLSKSQTLNTCVYIYITRSRVQSSRFTLKQ